jgi:glycerol-3-phosphate dehydrogenase subunit B
MKRGNRRIETELAVIGTGIAGFAASIFAMQRGLDVAQFGHSGAMAYTTGYLDLLGVHDNRVRQDPWGALDELRRDEPRHPMSGLTNEAIRSAFDGFTESLREMGIVYTKAGDFNLFGLLPNGIAKPTLSVPGTMLPGVLALETGAKTLVVDFEGLQGFSAKAFEVNFAERWPGLRSERLGFPGMESRQIFPEVLARSLETKEAQEALAALIRPLLNGADHVGLPAILGMHAPDAVRARMEEAIGATLFEIPTIPPAVPGTRLRECFERALPERGLKLEPQLKVADVEFGPSGATLHLHAAMEDLEVKASAVLLATGRFLSGGLKSDQCRLSESLLDLPIRQPEGRENWFREDYLDPHGHPINRFGVEVDDMFRPVTANGTPVNERLFAAGAILANQDWVRQRCGAGLAIATAHQAIEAAVATLV